MVDQGSEMWCTKIGFTTCLYLQGICDICEAQRDFWKGQLKKNEREKERKKKKLSFAVNHNVMRRPEEA